MGFRHKFEFGLAWRTVVLVLAIWLFSQALATPDLRAARIVAGLIAFAALASMWQFIRRTNFQVARFIESVRFEDYSQRFSDPSGGGFDVLGDALDAALKSLQARHVEAAAEARYLSAIVDDSPSALLALHLDGRPLTLLSGPERIQTGWWDGGDIGRDYYVARAQDGARWWIFRECDPPRRWFVHGCFA